ncbi:uncharacterized protein UDID_19542 [Ustilago sp. UG-2017a]|nr:uncharacterized protein UDID_19542 [Ustilago sp. UG-2017a]
MDPPPPQNLSFSQLHTALLPTFLGLAAVTDPALSLTHQPPPSDQTLRCNTCKQAQPLVAYKSWSVPRVITKSCLHCRNCTRNNRQGSTRRAARSVSVASAVTSDSNATHLSDIDGTYLQPPQPAPPVQPFPPRPFPAPPATQTLAREWEQNPSHQSVDDLIGLAVQVTRRIDCNPGLLIKLTGIDQNKLSQYVLPKRADQAIGTEWVDHHDQVIGGSEGGVPEHSHKGDHMIRKCDNRFRQTSKGCTRQGVKGQSPVGEGELCQRDQ